MTTLSMKMLDFDGSKGIKITNFVSETGSKARKMVVEGRRSLRSFRKGASKAILDRKMRGADFDSAAAWVF